MAKLSRPFATSLVVWLLMSSSCLALERDELFPFGSLSRDNELDDSSEDVSSAEIHLDTPVHFFGRQYDALYVNENGLVSFLTEIPSFFNVEFPLAYPLIAPLYADVDARGNEGGHIYYRLTKESDILDKVADTINDNFEHANFRPMEAIVVTWDRVGYFDRQTDKRNSFQLVLASSSTSSYVLLLYPVDGVQWTRAEGKNRNVPDAMAQAAICSGHGTHHALKGSGSDQIRSLTHWSNANKAGLWLFRVGAKDDESEDVVQPQIQLLPRFDWPALGSCGGGGVHVCHSMATCVDKEKESKYCCSCNKWAEWFGDGKTCVNANEPRRVSGSVSGNINGRSFVNQVHYCINIDFHSYAVPSEGRTYTALSKISPDIGFEMLFLTSIGTPVAWLFALNNEEEENEDLRNGFEVTGGVFNYSSESFFPASGDRTSLTFHFVGLDAFDYLRMEGNIRGTLPPHLTRPQNQMLLKDYSLDLVQVRPGLITANSRLVLGSEDGKKDVEVEVVHTFVYEVGIVCEQPQLNNRQTALMATRNYIVYDVDEEIVRFALTTHLTSDEVSADDGCSTVQCGRHAYCRINDEPECVCHAGFEKNNDDNGECVDVDECAQGLDDCSANGHCINEVGAFRCECDDNFVGDGIDCIELVTCDRLECASHAECVINVGGDSNAHCECMEGFEGDGLIECSIIPSSVSVSGHGHPREIAYNEDSSHPQFTHVYQVTNHGPHTVGHIKVLILLPLKDSERRALSELRENPVINYLSNNYEDNCQVLLERRRKRGSDYIYDENLVAQDYPEFDDYQEKLEMLYTAPDGYDYSHFEELIEDEVQDDPSDSFTCDLTLAPHESATITTNFFLDVARVKAKWNHVALLQLQSEAQLLPHEAIANQSSTAKTTVATLIKPSQPISAQGPGEGVSCGQVECSPYADCFVIFAHDSSTEHKCVCVNGFDGDGLQCQVREEEEEKDCRENDALCDQHALCDFDLQHGKFRCRCPTGMDGDGRRDGQGCRLINDNIDNDSNDINDDNDDDSNDDRCRSDSECGSNAHCGYHELLADYVCICNDESDNEHCVQSHRNEVIEETNEDNEVCRSHEECGPNGFCDYDQRRENYYCQCNHDFVRQGGQCTPAAPESGCEVSTKCHVDAECVSLDSGFHACICKPGFIGDGLTCQRDVIGCNVINDCSKYAKCLFNHTQRGYRCQCDENRGFVGDGRTCKPATTCRMNPALCDVNADCDANDICKCRDDFFGDGFSCQAIKRMGGNFLLISQGMAVVKVESGKRSKSGSRPILFKPFLTASDIDVDCRQGKVYWTDTSGRVIGRSNLDGSEQEVFLKVHLSFPEGLAIDFWGRKLYFTDAGKRTIEVVDIDDNERRAVIVEERVERPRAIALHPLVGRIFWTDWDRQSPRIESANLDGKDRFVLIQSQLAKPNGLAIDLDTYEICWTDAGDHFTPIAPKIECSDINGNGRRVVLELGDGRQPFGITLTAHTLYFTDWNKAGVHSVERRGSSTNVATLSHVLEKTGRPFGVVAVREKCVDTRGLNHACLKENVDNLCPADHMCVADSRQGHSCLCVTNCDVNNTFSLDY